jgi:hypothetical protein
MWVDQPQNQDGVAHFCYHDRIVNLTFAWDGFAPEIDVFRDDVRVGQMPIPAGYLSMPRNPGRWLAHFEVLCGLYIKERAFRESTASPVDPLGIRGDRVGSGEEEPASTER